MGRTGEKNINHTQHNTHARASTHIHIHTHTHNEQTRMPNANTHCKHKHTQPQCSINATFDKQPEDQIKLPTYGRGGTQANTRARAPVGEVQRAALLVDGTPAGRQCLARPIEQTDGVAVDALQHSNVAPQQVQVAMAAKLVAGGRSGGWVLGQAHVKSQNQPRHKEPTMSLAHHFHKTPRHTIPIPLCRVEYLEN